METPAHTSCRICHRPLTDLGSQIKGIGPICAKHLAAADQPGSLPKQRLLPFLRHTAPEIKTVDPEISRQFYARMTRPYCRSLDHKKGRDCGVDLRKSPIQYEDMEHDGGWSLPGVATNRWLFITCPKCGIQWSLQKLGV